MVSTPIRGIKFYCVVAVISSVNFETVTTLSLTESTSDCSVIMSDSASNHTEDVAVLLRVPDEKFLTVGGVSKQGHLHAQCFTTIFIIIILL